MQLGSSSSTGLCFGTATHGARGFTSMAPDGGETRVTARCDSGRRPRADGLPRPHRPPTRCVGRRSPGGRPTPTVSPGLAGCSRWRRPKLRSRPTGCANGSSNCPNAQARAGHLRPHRRGDYAG
jgi:hypothetical protein